MGHDPEKSHPQTPVGRSIRASLRILARLLGYRRRELLGSWAFRIGFRPRLLSRVPLEFLVALSCKGRGLYPSCAAKRAALFSQLLQRKILADVAHAQ